MTQTLIEQLEKLQLYWPGNRGEMYPAMTKEGSRPRYVGANDLRAIIEQHKSEAVEHVAIDSGYIEGTAERLRLICSKLGIGAPESNEELMLCQFSLFGLIRGKIDAIYKTQPDIVSELVKALGDDAYAATFQSMAGYRTALIAKAKGVVG